MELKTAQISLSILMYLKFCGTLIHFIEFNHRSVLRIKAQILGQQDLFTVSSNSLMETASNFVKIGKTTLTPVSNQT
jgi:hypothetical protein